MKIFILLLLSCVSVEASDTGIRLTSSTNADNVTAGAIITTETYTRNGQTNLIRITKSENGVAVYRSHQFCHDGKPVAFFTWRPDSTSFDVVHGTPYDVDLDFLPSKDARVVIIRSTHFWDGFYFTNGVFYPAPDSDLVMKPAQ